MHPLRRKVVTLDGRSGPGSLMLVPGIKYVSVQCPTPVGLWVLGGPELPTANVAALVTRTGTRQLTAQGAPVEGHEATPVWHPVYGLLLFGGMTADYTGHARVQVFAKPGLVLYTDWNEWANGTGGGTWQQLDTLPATQYGPAACMLASGKVLIAGGTNSAGTVINALAYMFTPGAGFTPITSIPSLTGYQGGMYRIPDGRCVLFMLDLSTPKMYAYNPSNNGWTTLTAPTLLGDMMLLGGALYTSDYTDGFMVYDPVANTWAAAPQPPRPAMSVPEAGYHSMLYFSAELPTGEWCRFVQVLHPTTYASISVYATLYTPANGHQPLTIPTW